MGKGTSEKERTADGRAATPRAMTRRVENASSRTYWVDVKTLSGALGHYSAGFTLNTYTHATAQMKQDAADAIGGVISQQMR